MTKLAIIAGHDVPQIPEAFVTQLKNENLPILATDSCAIAWAMEAGLCYLTIDNIVSRDDLRKARMNAIRVSEGWFKPLSELFRSTRLFWPSVDAEFLRWFWFNLTVADELTSSLKEQKTTPILFEESLFRPMEYYNPSDTFKRHIRHSMPSAITYRKILPDINAGILAGLKRTARNIKHLLSTRRLKATSGFDGKIVFALNPHEIFRFQHFVEQITDQMPAIILTDSPTSSQVELLRLLQVPFDVIQPGPNSSVESNRFPKISDILELLTPVECPTWNSAWIESFRPQLGYLLHHRWPKLSTNYTSWLRVIESTRPPVLIASSLHDAESQIPAYAARTAGVHTVALPHGLAGRCIDLPAINSILCPNEISMRAYLDSGVPPQKVECMLDSLGPEYPATNSSPESMNEGYEILILLDPCFHPGNIGPRFLPQEHLAALKSVNRLIEIDGIGRVRFKVHPRLSELRWLSAVGIDIENQVLPPDADLDVALTGADLVIGLNYTGSAIIHTVERTKPILFLWNAESESMTSAPNFVRIARRCGTLTRQFEELSSLVANWASNKLVRDDLQQKAIEAKRKWIESRKRRPFSEIIDQFLFGPRSNRTQQ